jgi:hypothetical protein
MATITNIKDHAAKTVEQLNGEFGALLRAARKDESQLPALESYFKENPNLFKEISPLVTAVLYGLIEKLSSGAVTDAIFNEEIKIRQRSLMEQGASPLERMLIENVMMSWLRLVYAELERNESSVAGSSLKYVKHTGEELTRAQKRFVQSVEALARIRGLLKSNKGSGK